jgi:hypothetical protein
MATTNPPDEMYLEESSDGAVEAMETPTTPHIPGLSATQGLSTIPDLSMVAGNGLRRVNEGTVVVTERNGDLYAPIFRQLQIRPDKYYEFHEHVVRRVRKKHHAEIRRATEPSLRLTTSHLLRGFGYTIWKPNSEWLLDDKDLDKGEARLMYCKNKEHDDDDDDDDDNNNRYEASSLPFVSWISVGETRTLAEDL